MRRLAAAAGARRGRALAAQRGGGGGLRRRPGPDGDEALLTSRSAVTVSVRQATGGRAHTRAPRGQRQRQLRLAAHEQRARGGTRLSSAALATQVKF